MLLCLTSCDIFQAQINSLCCLTFHKCFRPHYDLKYSPFLCNYCTTHFNWCYNFSVKLKAVCFVSVILKVNVVHISATAKNAADDKIRQSLRRFADTHPAETKIILISSELFIQHMQDIISGVTLLFSDLCQLTQNITYFTSMVWKKSKMLFGESFE